ncbi:Uracil phosphoribosyltransferase [Lachnellula suecica]|uniref:Uracil phosphoribosyltransferase n=1 Tax=Lachnellula suecica TaxID=602035 RepID=A0A8T9C7T3_9HELO|nr:Uracil phosphoribosyltransferase [Lachnellula suecica]
MTTTNISSTSSALHPDTQSSQSPVTPSRSASDSTNKAVVIGLFGVDGSGKTHLLRQLEKELEDEPFVFYDGSQIIDEVVLDGGLKAFQKMTAEKKKEWRKVAIDTIAQRSVDSGKAAVVAGHYLFWKDGKPEVAWTPDDAEVYNHILYLDVPVEIVLDQTQKDEERNRSNVPVDQLKEWQALEKNALQDECPKHDILFSLLTKSRIDDLNYVSALMKDFQQHSEKGSLDLAKSKLDEALIGKGKVETVLVFDADKTLTQEDTGKSFWDEAVDRSQGSKSDDRSVEKMFGGPLEYSYTAFRQAVLLYEEIANDAEYELICEKVASTVIMHPEFLSLLRLAESQKHVGTVVVTCGLRLLWEKVIERYDLSKTVKIIGGGRISDGYVVTAEVKAALVEHLQETHKMYVAAFGDSQLDLKMMLKADRSVVVVGNKKTRSKSMDKHTRLYFRAIHHPGWTLRPFQSWEIMDWDFLDTFIRSDRPGRSNANIKVIQATPRGSTKILATSTRDSNIAGPALRESHRRIGFYLATEFLTDLIGLEVYPMMSVQDKKIEGHRLAHEAHTSIVPLMRGGEPMAFGVSDAFPLAMFVHAKEPENLKVGNLQGQRTVILVDSVVNSGKSVIEFVQHIRKLSPRIRIVVVAAVVQDEAVKNLQEKLTLSESFDLVALRFSKNKFVGSGKTDTGDRLFNTTHLG